MTKQETTALEHLRDEVREYHGEVKQLVAYHENLRTDVGQMQADLYGLPGKKELCPGLMDRVSDLQSGRRAMLWALRGAWALVLTAIGAGLATMAR